MSSTAVSTVPYEDLFTCIFALWNERALRYALRAIYTYMDARTLAHVDALFRRDLLPLPELGDEDYATEYWLTALERFAFAEDEVLKHPQYRAWARALVLGTFSMTTAAREVLLSRDRCIMSVLQVKPPSEERLRRFVPLLQIALQRFSDTDYRDPTSFVEDARWAATYGTLAPERG
jgi:hypothetical protein